MTNEELKAHQAKNEADRDAMVRNALSLVAKERDSDTEGEGVLCCQVVQHQEFLGIRSRGYRNGQKCVQRKMLSRRRRKFVSRFKLEVMVWLRKRLAELFSSWGCECSDS